MTIKIDKNVPIPVQIRKKKYPFDSMEIGDSFFAPGMTTTSIAATVHRAAKTLSVKFRTRSVTENGVAGVRVWRVEMSE